MTVDRNALAAPNSYARVSQLPYRNGDGYSWGGEVILTIGERSIMFGAGNNEWLLAKELADAWNAHCALASEGWE